LILAISTGRPDEVPEDLTDEVPEELTDDEPLPVDNAQVPAGGGSRLLDEVLAAALLRGALPISRMPQSVSAAVAPVPIISKNIPPAARNIVDAPTRSATRITQI
jgi:hypothetical protein